jgi:hypothetical protein
MTLFVDYRSRYRIAPIQGESPSPNTKFVEKNKTNSKYFMTNSCFESYKAAHCLGTNIKAFQINNTDVSAM